MDKPLCQCFNFPLAWQICVPYTSELIISPPFHQHLFSGGCSTFKCWCSFISKVSLSSATLTYLSSKVSLHITLSSGWRMSLCELALLFQDGACGADERASITMHGGITIHGGITTHGGITMHGDITMVEHLPKDKWPRWLSYSDSSTCIATLMSSPHSTADWQDLVRSLRSSDIIRDGSD